MSDAINNMARVLTGYRCKPVAQPYKHKQAAKREHHADGQLMREHHIPPQVFISGMASSHRH